MTAATPMHNENSHARVVCGAKTRSGKPCGNTAVLANGRCRMHGGKMPVGAALPQFKTGRYSKYLPERLMERYQQAAADPELLALRDEIALIDARLNDLLSRVEAGEAGVLWENTRKAWLSYLRKRDTPQEHEAQSLLDELIERGANEYQAWAEVHVIIEQRRKLSESEQKRLVAMRQMVTSEQAMMLIVALQDAVKRHVTDRAVLAAIAADVAALSNRQAS